ncbi:Tkl/drk protein kinase [Globisporangium polare]
MALDRQQRRRLRVRNATDATASIIIPAESMFVFNGTSADLAQQFYQRYQAGDALKKLDIPLDKLPASVKERLASFKLKFKSLHSLLQRALLWDSGYVLDGGEKSELKLVKIYTANGTSMADIAVSYEEFTGVAGCSAANCSASIEAGGATYRSSAAKCSGEKLMPVLRCASEDVKGDTSASSGSTVAFWATGGGRWAIPELSIVRHTWEDASLNATYSVSAIHSISLASESAQEDCAAAGGRAPSMVIPCARYADVGTSSATTWAEPAHGKLVSVWLEHARADRPGFSTTYMVLIIVAIIVGLVLLITLGCKGKSSFKKRKQRREEAKMTSADPQAFLDNSQDEVLEASAIALTPVHAILESDLESTNSNSIDWHNAFVSHRAVAGKRLRMDQLVLKKLVAQRQDATTSTEIWAAKYHSMRVAVKKQTVLGSESSQSNPSTNSSYTPEISAEIELLASLRHRNIVRFYGVAWDSPDSLCVITEYARKGSLQGAMANAHQPLTWHQTQRIMTGITKALQYLHERPEPVVHGNLSAENVLLTSHFEPKLIGVGAARREAANCEEAQRAATQESDMYALGVLLSELIAHSDAQHRQTRFHNTEEQKSEEAEPVGTELNCPQKLRDLVSRCVNVIPEARPTLSEVLNALIASSETK